MALPRVGLFVSSDCAVQYAISAGFTALAGRRPSAIKRRWRVEVIPVGLAFEEAYRQRPGVKLHKDFDGSHPDLLGTYLAACVTFPWSILSLRVERYLIFCERGRSNWRHRLYLHRIATGRSGR